MNDVSMDKQRYLIKASGVAAALFAGIAENGFSASYFSYALAAFLLYICQDPLTAASFQMFVQLNGCLLVSLFFMEFF